LRLAKQKKGEAPGVKRGGRKTENARAQFHGTKITPGLLSGGEGASFVTWEMKGVTDSRKQVRKNETEGGKGSQGGPKEGDKKNLRVSGEGGKSSKVTMFVKKKIEP